MSRVTAQRRAVEQVFEDATGPLTAREVHGLAEQRVEGLGIATVYRHLKKMVEQDLLDVVELAGQPTRYESSALRHHHHFQCLECERVYDVPGCADFSGLVPDDFRVLQHEIVLYGACAACQ